MRWVYLSPHLDDAVLSCGGLIYEQARQGMPVAIWTFMAGYPWQGSLSEFASRLHAEWGTGSAVRTVFVRRKEDRSAASLLGAQVRHFRFLDMIYRQSGDGTPLYSENVFFVERHPDDKSLPEHLAQTLHAAINLDDVLVCPLAIGGHLDHILVREAAEKLGRPLWYYADVPYILQYPNALSAATRGMVSTLFPIREDGLQAWINGVQAYVSQLSTVFRDGSKPAEALRNYWALETGLRLWQTV